MTYFLPTDNSLAGGSKKELFTHPHVVDLISSMFSTMLQVFVSIQ